MSRIELMRGSLGRAHELGVAAAERVEGEDPARAVMTLYEAALPCFMSGRIELARDTSARAHALCAGLDGQVVEASAVIYGSALVIAGESERGRALIGVWDASHEPELLLVNPPLLLAGTQSLMWMEEYETSLANCDAVIELSRALGAIGPLQLTLGQRSDLHYRLGDWEQARADASESVRLAEDTGQLVQGTFPLAVLTRLEAALGLVEESRLHAREVMGLARSAGMDSMLSYVAAAECLERLGSGEVEQAVADGREVRRLLEGFGMRDPSVVQWRPDFIEALVRADLCEEAAAELVLFEEQASRAQRPWVLGAAARCRGLLADERAFEAEFEAALAHHAQGADPFERARTELAYGECLRRARRPSEARRPLRSALETFDALGAEPWARRARSELRASGGSVPAAGRAISRELTGQELEVALRVARGATNRETAAALYLSPKTVEAHLGRVFRKLGVRSRTQLAMIVGVEGPTTVVEPSPLGSVGSGP